MYEKVFEKFREIIEKNWLQKKEITCEIIAEGSGKLFIPPSRDFIRQSFELPSQEYALAKGKEVLLRCRLENHWGDAFTDDPKPFKGELKDVDGLVFGNKGEKAIFFAALNATLSYLGLVRGTVHCRGDEPRKCGERLATYIMENFGKVRIAHIGYQPGHIEACSKYFESFVTDLNPENVGKVRFGREILDGSANEEIIKKANVACITGSALTNGTLPELIEWCKIYEVEPLIYGVTGVGASKILNLRHFCPYGRDCPF
jgi:hypothetical protein